MNFLGILLLTVAAAYADDALQELKQGNLAFSAALYQELIKDNPGNIILSPISVQLVLALTQLGAKGETAAELTKGLCLPNSPEKLKEAFKALLPKLKGNKLYNLNSANKVYLKDGLTINPELLKLAQEIFDAELENIDFADGVKASKTINNWVESKTNNKIKDLISPDMLSALTRLVLVNAVYFKANWSSPFDDDVTHKKTFFKSEKEEIKVETMHQVIEQLQYGENTELDARFLEIPYVGGNVYFTIALPNRKEGLAALENRLREVLLPQNLSDKRVILYMPKFKIESSFSLVSALKQMGIKKVFDDSASDLSGLLASPLNLSISNVIQKAFINATETGTEAAAATDVLVGESLDYPTSFPVEFRVDHPFLFTISVKNVGVIFIGRVVDPLS